MQDADRFGGRRARGHDVVDDEHSLLEGVYRLDDLDAAGNVAQQTVNLTLSMAIPLTVTSLTPTDGAEDVGVAFRPKVVFAIAAVTIELVFLSALLLNLKGVLL